MTAEDTPPEPSAGAAAGEGEEPRRLGTPFLVLQFFIFPMSIVAVCVAVFVVFGLIASEGKGARAYLEDIRRGGGSVIDPNRRWHAAHELSKVLQDGNDPALRDPAFVSDVLAVFEGAKRDDPRVRRYLALALGRLRDKRAVPALLEAARAEQGAPGTDADTQLYAVVALGSIGDPAAVPELLRLSGSDDPGVRKAVAHALGSFPSDATRAALVSALADPVEDVRWNAALALARRGDEAAAPVLLAMMDRRRLDGVPGLVPQQRDEAMLEAIRVAPAVPEPSLRAALERLREHDPSVQVRQAAALALQAPAPAAR